MTEGAELLGANLGAPRSARGKRTERSAHGALCTARLLNRPSNGVVRRLVDGAHLAREQQKGVAGALLLDHVVCLENLGGPRS